jgi:Galactose oxidase, central domain
LDVENFDKWRELPPYPISNDIAGNFRSLIIVVHEDKAYLFTGRPQVDYFDLISEQWGSIMTTFKRKDGKPGSAPWLFPDEELREYTMQLVEGRIYVFGGCSAGFNPSSDLLVMLDIASQQWTKLSGTVKPRPDHFRPGPRSFPVSWVNKRQDTIFVMSGGTDLARPGDSYNYDDVWSWNIPDRRWRREKMTGNTPCSRTEMACTYVSVLREYYPRRLIAVKNPTLDKVILFGGYSSVFPTLWADESYIDGFAYYGDTFISYPTSSDSPLKWKHILTRGFPSYRAQAQLVSDPVTGKTFLFGGYTGRGLSPSGSSGMIGTFGDIWQLRIDEPGGYFEGVDFEEESRTARPGPWQRCFTCACVGPFAKKCGGKFLSDCAQAVEKMSSIFPGTCQGRAFFCDSECLAAGWKEHRRMHGCRKL